MNTIQHTLSLETWSHLSLPEKMAHIGAEVGRSLKWRQKGKSELQQKACFRALELIDLSLATSSRASMFKEFTRMRELLIDHLVYDNQWQTSPESWNSYFHYFNLLANKNRQ